MLYSRACAQYCDFLDRGQLLIQKLHRQCYVASRLPLKIILQSSSQSGFPLRNIHISNDYSSFTFDVDVFFSLSLPRPLPHLTVCMSSMLTLPEHLSSPTVVFDEVRVTHRFSLLCCSIMCLYILSSVL